MCLSALNVECIHHIKERIVSYILTKRPYKRYQKDLVLTVIELKMNKFKYIFLHELIIFQNMLGQYQS